MAGQHLRIRPGVPVLTGAEALAALGLPPAPLRVERWLVERGEPVELDQPLLEATLPGAEGPVPVLSQHAAVVDRRFPSPGTLVEPGSPLLTLTAVRAFVALPSRLTGAETGVLVSLRGRGVVLLLPPGLNEVQVGRARVRVTVEEGRLTTVSG